MRWNVIQDNEGATLVEFSIVSVLLFLITFSFVEFGYVFYQFNNAQKATQLGARVAATRAMISGVEDCWVSTSLPAGTDCASVDNSGAPSIVCSGSSSGSCDAASVAIIVQEMKKAYPSLDAANIQITLSPTNLGYVGRGKPVPAITVEVNNIQYDYVVIGGLLSALDSQSSFTSSVGITSAQTTLIGEDIGEGAS